MLQSRIDRALITRMHLRGIYYSYLQLEERHVDIEKKVSFAIPAGYTGLGGTATSF